MKPVTKLFWICQITAAAIFFGGLVTHAQGGGTEGQMMGDVAAGRTFAEAVCARCHAVGRTGASPFEPAPPFRTFAAKWPLETLEEALAEGISVGHPDMPEFVLSPEQIDDFLAYLHSVQDK